jgi:phosphogluconate dehydratase
VPDPIVAFSLPPRGGARPVHPVVAAVTEQIVARSRGSRSAYLASIDQVATGPHPRRAGLGCANQAHGFAACGPGDKLQLRRAERAQLGIVTAYNDMLSAHQPYATYPDILKDAARSAGALAQVAGGVPAMCDGITQGYPGMELSLFSREVVALSTAVALSHDVFDGALLLGVCDKIVPGLLIGALQFGHLPVALVPAGPMASGLSNLDKKRVRNRHAEGRADTEELMDAEAASYHSAGTCTFYGTANSNQLVVEVMGLHLPGAAFVSPHSALRVALTRATAQRLAELTRLGDRWLPVGRLVDERTVVNAVVALLATGGSTNHTLHLVAIAAAAGIELTWSDIDQLSAVVPLVARIYPNGPADVNHFHAAGGTSGLIGTLLDAGLLHEDVETLAGQGLSRYRYEAQLDGERLAWTPAPTQSRDTEVLAAAATPFQPDGGLKMLSGPLGRAVIKVSAVDEAHRIVEAPVRVFDDQVGFLTAFEEGELDRDVVVVVRFQGPRANGMPELHKLVPALSVLLGRGHHVALVTDGRMSGASGTVPAAIHVTPEAAAGGLLARLVDGDVVRLDTSIGRLDVLSDITEVLDRAPAATPESPPTLGRGLFAPLRGLVGPADAGASIFGGATRSDSPVDTNDLVELTS